MMATLCELSLGEEARVASVQTTAHAHQRLMMMGLLPGTLLRLIHVAPLGDPIGGYASSIVEADGRTIWIDLPIRRDGMLLPVHPVIELLEGEEPFEETVRYRTIGDVTCTGAVRSTATTVDDVILEVAATRITERGATRADDRISEAGMEDRKREGYF